MNIFVSLSVSLALTLALELIPALAWGLKGKDILLCVLVNIVTNPVVVLVHYIFAGYTSVPLWIVKTVLELSAVTVEWLIYKYCSCGIRRPLLFSVCANGFSFFCGILINIVIRSII